MIPTEHEGTVAVDAAARKAYDLHVDELVTAGLRAPGASVPFDELGPIGANAWRGKVLPTVWAALEALPERPTFPAGLFVDTDADDEPCVWRIDLGQGGGPYLVARRCDVSDLAWTILYTAAAVPA